MIPFVLDYSADVPRKSRPNLNWLLLGLAFLGSCVIGLAQQAAHSRIATSRSVATQTDIYTIGVAMDAFEIDCGRYPTTAEGLAPLYAPPPDVAANWNGPYLNRAAPLLDPWGRPYLLRPASPTATAPYRIVSRGPDGKEGNADDVRSSP